MLGGCLTLKRSRCASCSSRRSFVVSSNFCWKCWASDAKKHMHTLLLKYPKEACIDLCRVIYNGFYFLNPPSYLHRLHSTGTAYGLQQPREAAGVRNASITFRKGLSLGDLKCNALALSNFREITGMRSVCSVRADLYPQRGGPVESGGPSPGRSQSPGRLVCFQSACWPPDQPPEGKTEG